MNCKKDNRSVGRENGEITKRINGQYVIRFLQALRTEESSELDAKRV
jgi:hypothetical protein